MPTIPTEYIFQLTVNPPVMLVPVNSREVKADVLNVYILMGPTGSGKSAFIESMSPCQDLKIAKDSLESVTQIVTCYNMECFQGGLSVVKYLVMDTPGFLDTKLSESRITTMITDELDSLCKSGSTMFVQLLYFQPITDIRLGGSKRSAAKLMAAFAEAFDVSNVTVVTTMWDQLSTFKQIVDANRRLRRLENEIFARSYRVRFDIAIFRNSSDSALSMLNESSLRIPHNGKKLQKKSPNYQLEPLIRDNLLNRISNTQQQLLNLAEEKQLANTPGKKDRGLLKVVRRDEKLALTALQNFLDDLYAFDPDAYHTHFPDLPFPRPPPRVPLSVRFRSFAASLNGIFKWS